MKITGFDVVDVRFPTSLVNAGTDAVHTDPDYSAAYVIVKTDGAHRGHGFAFTIGRGNEVVVAAIRALEPLVVGTTLADIIADQAGFWRRLANETQLRWLGPEKGVIHLAQAAIVNAVWDLQAKAAGKPVWKLLADMIAARDRQLHRLPLHHRCADAGRGAGDARAAVRLTGRAGSDPAARTATRRIRRQPAGSATRTTKSGGCAARRSPRAGATSRSRSAASRQTTSGGCGMVRETIGPDCTLMIDANQRWDVSEAIARVRALAQFDLWWIEEPTSPDDVLGHAAIAKGVAPIGVATGEHAANRVIFKQLLQAKAISFCQIDSCRLGGVNENLAVILMAAKFGVPLCPHAGGVGLCELVQHLSMFDYVCVSGRMDDRVTEFVDHLHEHFVDPTVIQQARYRAPERPGYSSEMFAASIAEYRFPDGPAWRS